MHLVKNRVLPLLLVTLPLLIAMAGSRPRSRQVPVRPAAAPAGVWKGTSICLQGKPVCKDEVVVYHIAVVPAKPAHFATIMNKLVDGREEQMGALDCRYDAPLWLLECPMPADKRPGTWRFRVRDRQLDGELIVPDGSVFRRIQVARVN